MSSYDDEGLIALLREAVPAAPDLVPDRVAAVRHVARRQRSLVWAQSLGAVVAVLLIAGVAAAVAPRGTRTLQPVDHPLQLVAETLPKQGSFAFELTMEPVGEPAMIRPGEPEQVSGRITGATTVDGRTFHAAGDLPLFTGGSIELRGVDGKRWVKVPEEAALDGRPWLPATGDDATSADVEHYLRLAAAVVDETPFLGRAVVRGVDVMQYRVVVPRRYTNDQQVDVVLSVDADGLPRRIDAEFPYLALDTSHEQPDTGLRVHARLDLFGFGDPVRVSAPPADQVADSGTPVGPTEPGSAWQLCMREAAAHHPITTEDSARCEAKYGHGAVIETARPVPLTSSGVLTPVPVP